MVLVDKDKITGAKEFALIYDLFAVFPQNTDNLTYLCGHDTSKRNRKVVRFSQGLEGS